MQEEISFWSEELPEWDPGVAIAEPCDHDWLIFPYLCFSHPQRKVLLKKDAKYKASFTGHTNATGIPRLEGPSLFLMQAKLC